MHQVAAEQNRGPPCGEDGDTLSTGAAHGPELTVMGIYQSFSSQLAATAMVTIQSLLAHGEPTERVHSIINFTADMCRAGRSTCTASATAPGAAPPVAAIALQVSPNREATPGEHAGRGVSPIHPSRPPERPSPAKSHAHGRAEQAAAQPQPRARADAPTGPVAGRARHHPDRVFTPAEDAAHRAADGHRYSPAEVLAHKALQRQQAQRDTQRTAADERQRPRGPSSKRSSESDRDPDQEHGTRSRRGRNY